MFDSRAILLGEISCLSLLGDKVLREIELEIIVVLCSRIFQKSTKMRLFREAYTSHDSLMRDAVNGQGMTTNSWTFMFLSQSLPERVMKN